MIKKELAVSAILLSLAVGSNDLLSMPRYLNEDLKKACGVWGFSASPASGANGGSGRSSGVPSPAASPASGASGGSGRSSGVPPPAASPASGANWGSGRSSGVPSPAASPASGANGSSGRSSGVPSPAASPASGANGGSGRSSGVPSPAASPASGANGGSGRSSGVPSPAASPASGANGKEQIDLSVFFEKYKEIEKEKIRGKWKKMREIQQNLLPRMVLYDTLGNGWCGFYSLLALLHAQDDLPVISIAIEEVNKCMGKIGGEISRQGSNNTDEIVTLKAVLSKDRRYHKYVVGDSDFNWDQLCADIAGGKVWFDYAFLPFAYEALGVYQFDCVDGNNPRALGEIPDCGGVINYGGNHFMVAIPEDLPSGGKRRGLRCQDFNGRWWFSESGKPAVPEDPSQEESLLFPEAFREEPTVHEELIVSEEKDSVFEES